MKQINKKIVVGMSGGVDSSITALLLKQQGWQPIGLSLDLPVWQGKKSFQPAKKICQKLNIPHHILNVKKDFEKEVVQYFNQELKNNQTPNPCVLCNRFLKFKKILEFAQKKKIKYVATGHYAKIKKDPLTNQHQLLKPKDKTKDQTYNLCFLTQNQLKQIIFPLADYTKKQVYQLAKKENLSFLTQQKESQDFCYLTNTTINKYLQKTFKNKPGKILNTKKQKLGTHQGLHFYTIGQRKGIHLSGGPYFVKQLNPKTNTLIVTKNEKELCQKELTLKPFNFISNKTPKKPIKVMAKIRYGHKEQSATLYPPKDKKLKIKFEKPQRAITPGQFAVFYQKNICLGGGKILRS